MDKEDLQKFVNQIFKRKGFPPVRNFAKEFADGILFELLFNIMYDEKINCRLVPSAIIEDRILNWSKINCKSFSDSLFAHKNLFFIFTASICFNYLQQKFYLVEPTMKSLAKGQKSDAIFKLIKVLISTQQQDYQEAIGGDTNALGDISDNLQTNQ